MIKIRKRIDKMIDDYNNRSREYLQAASACPSMNGNEYLAGKAKGYAEMVDDLIKLKQYIVENA